MAIENQPDVRRLLRRTFEAPGEAIEDLPELLAAVEHPDRVDRIGAAWALCAVAASRPEVAATVRRELVDRSGTAAELAATWIGREVLSGEGVPTAGDAIGGDEGRSSSGQATTPVPPGGDDGGDGNGDKDSAIEETSFTDEDDQGDGRTGGASGTGAGRTADERTGGSRTADERASGGRTPDGRDEVVDGDRFTVELDRTTLDALEIVDHVATDRVSWTYVGMAEIDAERTAVLVRTFRPPFGAHPTTFGTVFEDVLAAWSGVDDHEGVLTVHDFGRRPHPWTVLDYAPRTLRTTGRLPTRAALRVGLDAATALAHAHERGVTHRCLDPRNVAIDEVDGRPVGKLFGFGIVDAFRAVNGPLPMDSRYAAPELFDEGIGPVDYMTDVYHLGATLYTAFTGEPPYAGSLVDRGGPAGCPYDPPSSVVESLPVAADRIVSKAMATHKIARYESADELARDLQSALDDLEDPA